MNLPPEIQRAVNVIDQKIESLRQVREGLISQFGTPSATGAKQVTLADASAKTSKDKVAEYLELHQPALRKDIIEGTGLPAGTVSFALNDKKRFRHNDNGWLLVTSGRTTTAVAVPSAGKTDDDENKTVAVRHFFRERADKGVKPKELMNYLKSSGVTSRANYTYSAIARLKKSQEIEQRGTRYFPTEKLLQQASTEVVQ